MSGEKDVVVPGNLAQSEESWHLHCFVAGLGADEVDVVRDVGRQRSWSGECVTPLFGWDVGECDPMPVLDLGGPQDWYLLVWLDN